MTGTAIGLLFPGQGAQFVGMGHDLADSHAPARQAFEEADEALGYSLSRLCWEGPQDELVHTRNAQPAILVHSIAVWRAVCDEVSAVAVAAGHSLGEFSAYVAAGSLGFADAVRLVRRRGDLMFEAGRARPGTMAAVLGLGDEEVERACGEASRGPGEVAVAANFNAPGQVVISGDRAAVQRAADAARQAGARRVMPLQVSGAFHSPLMAAAERGLTEHLASTPFLAPRFAVVSNVTAQPISQPGRARELLVEQLTRPVRWTASLGTMAENGVSRFLELGPGNVLAGLLRRSVPTAKSRSIGTAEQVDEFLRVRGEAWS